MQVRPARALRQHCFRALLTGSARWDLGKRSNSRTPVARCSHAAQIDAAAQEGGGVQSIAQLQPWHTVACGMGASHSCFMGTTLAQLCSA